MSEQQDNMINRAFYGTDWTPTAEPEDGRVIAERAACAALCREAGCVCRGLAAGDGAARFTNCPECNGKGWHYGDCHPRETCGICNGEGAVVEVHDPRCPDALASRIEARGAKRKEAADVPALR